MKKQSEPAWRVIIEGEPRPILDSSHETPVGAYLRQLELRGEGESRKVLIFSPPAWDSYAARRKSSGLPGIRRRPKRVSNPRRSQVKDALASEALRFKVFPEFASRYWNDCARGIYWVATDDPRFELGPKEELKAKAAKFTVGCNPDFALSGANAKKAFVAELNVNRLGSEKVVVKRGTDGAEIKLLGLEDVEVLRVIDAAKARRAFKYQQSLLPSSKDQLKVFWEWAWDREQERLHKEREKEGRAIARGRKKADRERRAKEKAWRVSKEGKAERAAKRASKRTKRRVQGNPGAEVLVRAIPMGINQPGAN